MPCTHPNSIAPAKGKQRAHETDSKESAVEVAEKARGRQEGSAKRGDEDGLPAFYFDQEVGGGSPPPNLNHHCLVAEGKEAPGAGGRWVPARPFSQ